MRRFTSTFQLVLSRCMLPYLNSHSFHSIPVNNLPVYLESTEKTVPMYEMFGFVGIDGFEIEIPRRRGTKMPPLIVYWEVCIVWSSPENK